MEGLQLVAAVALLAGNFFFVAVEFSVTSARPTMVDDLVERGASGARSLQHGVRHIDAYLSACQLGITVCSIGLGITAEPVVAGALGAVFPEFTVLGIGAAAIAFVLAYGTVSTFHVVLGELAPKSLAIARTERTGLLLVPPMRVVYLATKPAVDALNGMGNLVLKPFGIPPASEAGHAPHTEEELRTLITRSEEAGVLEPEEKSFTEGVFGFGDRRAREVMVPRSRVTTLRVDDSVEDAARAAVATGHTRVPLCEPDGDLDAVVGVVHWLPLLRATLEDGRADLRAVSTPVLRASDMMLLDELLASMRQRREHMAVLSNEYGTVVGVVTLEDVLEEIVGDIRDEYDPAKEQPVEVQDDSTVRVRGDAALHEVSRELGLVLEEGRATTLGGYLVETLGHTPAPGERFLLEAWEAVVAEADGPAVTSVTLRPRQDETAASDRRDEPGPPEAGRPPRDGE